MSAAEQSPEPAKPSWLRKMVAGGHLRYWIIGSWAVALATEVRLPWVIAWFAATMAAGLGRGHFEKRYAGDPTKRLLILTIVLLSCAVWAIAPLLAWFDSHAYGESLAVVLLCAGYTLVFTQMRSNPREALIVSIPYSLVTAVLIASLWGRPGFWTLVAMAPVLACAMVIKVVITAMKDDSLAAILRKQEALIGELETARDQATAASDAKSAFLGVISHELRTPMNGVLGAAQLLDAMALEERQKSYVAMIRTSGEGLLSLLNDILDMTKIEAGHMELHPTEVETPALIERLVGPFRAQAEAKGLDFVLTTTGALPAAMTTDYLRVGQIVHNLLSNAVKFTDAGQVRLAIHAERLGDDLAALSIEVTDTGSGIEPGDLDRMFQPFAQVDGSSTRRFGGTGLGLTIARRLAHMMGGDITVASTPGLGSRFTLSAPVEVVAWDAPEQSAAPVAEDGPDSRSQHVLVVEDHAVNRMILQAWLSAQGHSCVTAENGQIGVEEAAMIGFDLIIMDVNMPVMDGLTATRMLRAMPGLNQHTPVVVLSASARPEDHETGFAAGADAYLNKPLEMARLAEVMRASALGRQAVRLNGRPEEKAA